MARSPVYFFSVMPGLDPGIEKAASATRLDWIAGSNPATTIREKGEKTIINPPVPSAG
jgi:hypothetical protein